MKLFIPILLLLLLSCANNQPANTGTRPTRVISLAPNITEMLYELKLGDKIVGVTPFCKYPRDAELVENKIDGRNYEMILRAAPDLAVILKEQTDLAAFFDRRKIRYAAVGSDSVDEILASIQTIAEACGVGERGVILINDLRGRIEAINVIGIDGVVGMNDIVTPRPKVLLCVGREHAGSRSVNKCFAAGAVSFYNELIETAGGVNVMKEVKQAYPSISAESVIRLNPDIIIDLSFAYSGHSENSSRTDNNNYPSDMNCADWNAFKTVSAVNTGRVYCPTGEYLTIPGPRFVMILEEFARIFRDPYRVTNRL